MPKLSSRSNVSGVAITSALLLLAISVVAFRALAYVSLRPSSYFNSTNKNA